VTAGGAVRCRPVKRPRRILLDAATAMSIVLLAASAVIWMRGRWVHDKVVWTTNAGRLVTVKLFHTGIGVIVIGGWPSTQPVRWLAEGQFETAGPVFHLSTRQAAARVDRSVLGVYTQAGHGHTHRAADGTALWYEKGSGYFADSADANHCDRLPPLAYQFVCVNYPIPVATFGELPLCRGGAAAWRHVRKRRRACRGQCPDCGYDCRATPDRCPECGRACAATAPAQ
jgi:hypothetical protein